jgi:hypothetical protein
LGKIGILAKNLGKVGIFAKNLGKSGILAKDLGKMWFLEYILFFFSIVLPLGLVYLKSVKEPKLRIGATGEWEPQKQQDSSKLQKTLT